MPKTANLKYQPIKTCIVKTQTVLKTAINQQHRLVIHPQKHIKTYLSTNKCPSNLSCVASGTSLLRSPNIITHFFLKFYLKRVRTFEYIQQQQKNYLTYSLPHSHTNMYTLYTHIHTDINRTQKPESRLVS